MRHDRLSPASTAALFFDFLNGHVKTGDAATAARYAPVIARAAELLDLARGHGMMVLYANGSHRPDNATSASTIRDTDNRLRPIGAGGEGRFEPTVRSGTYAAQVIEELAPTPADYIVPKYRWNAFHQTYLELALRTRGIHTIIVCGGSTDVGIASTVYAARDLDYSVVVARDACTSPERDNHEQFMARVFPRMARVRTVAEIREMLSRGSADAALPPAL